MNVSFRSSVSELWVLYLLFLVKLTMVKSPTSRGCSEEETRDRAEVRKENM